MGSQMAAVVMAITILAPAAAAESVDMATGVGHAAAASLPSLCFRGEYAIVDASVRPFGVLASKRVETLQERFVSICADRAHEPYWRVVYRFGRPGHIELQRAATPSKRFRLWTRSTSPHTGENLIGFSVGAIRYDIGIATVMGSGVIVRAFTGRRQLVNLASGTTEGVDFRMGPAAVDFDRVSSPVFELGYPFELDEAIDDPSNSDAPTPNPK